MHVLRVHHDVLDLWDNDGSCHKGHDSLNAAGASGDNQSCKEEEKQLKVQTYNDIYIYPYCSAWCNFLFKNYVYLIWSRSQTDLRGGDLYSAPNGDQFMVELVNG